MQETRSYRNNGPLRTQPPEPGCGNAPVQRALLGFWSAQTQYKGILEQEGHREPGVVIRWCWKCVNFVSGDSGIVVIKVKSACLLLATLSDVRRHCPAAAQASLCLELGHASPARLGSALHVGYLPGRNCSGCRLSHTGMTGRFKCPQRRAS